MREVALLALDGLLRVEGYTPIQREQVKHFLRMHPPRGAPPARALPLQTRQLPLVALAADRPLRAVARPPRRRSSAQGDLPGLP